MNCWTALVDGAVFFVGFGWIGVLFSRLRWVLVVLMALWSFRSRFSRLRRGYGLFVGGFSRFIKYPMYFQSKKVLSHPD
ncbi:hypothetical protein [Sporosarcina sp. 6E9]|uniref:hypothetical protein n=1 Tax=Sporosarcina sp. 6E9 TaxID=2819235 RepID=UPI001B311889|nr:hypothetical protein [Sporosarcina sp. 6E9]